MSPDFQRHESVDGFRQAVLPALLQDEAANNLMIGILEGLKAPSNVYLATVHTSGNLALAALRTPPHKLILALAEQADPKSLERLIDDLEATDPLLPGCLGTEESAGPFNDLWIARMHCVSTIERHMGVHVLTSPNDIREAPGRAEVATMQHLEQLIEWDIAFAREIEEDPSGQERAAQVRRLVEARRYLVWLDEERQLASCAALARETPNYGCINAVYTPPNLRGRGYATSLVAALARKILASGKKGCCLYTDLANPTSNRIYHAIGFRPLQDQLALRFTY